MRRSSLRALPADAAGVEAAAHGRPAVAGLPAADGIFLGPASVVAVETDGAVRVAGPSGEVRAEMALPVAYEAVPGDVLLVVGRGEEQWVIGVIAGKGRTTLSTEGDLTLRSAGGAIALEAERGVAIRGASFDVDVQTLRVIAHDAIETFASALRRVASLFSVHAGSTHTVVENGSYTQAKTAAIQTEETVTINGKQIHLG
jgi:hypothetical protein